jgi:acyl-CoA thioesterase YciA
MHKLHTKHHEDMALALRVLPMPKDTNPSGDIFGGWIMAQVDMAGGIIATQAMNSRVVTIAVTEFLFKQPVFVGDIISCYGKVTKTGKTSITIFIEVCAQREGIDEECIKVTEATLVYVAVDEHGKPKEYSKPIN